MTDAQVIPIGSGGRPGRGTGRRTTPSAAARSLAGATRRKPADDSVDNKTATDDATASDAASDAATDAAPAGSSGFSNADGASGLGASAAASGRSSAGKRAKPKAQRSKAKATATDKAAPKRATGRKPAGTAAGDGEAAPRRATGRKSDDKAAGAAGRGAAAGDGAASRGEPADAGRANVRAMREDGAGRRGDDEAVRTAAGADAAAAGFGDAAGSADGARVDAGQFEAFERMVRDTLGAGAERKVAELLAFLRRRLTGEYEVDEFGFDPELTDTVLMPLVRPMAEKWFRVDVRGVENIPADGGALIVANHSGTLPIDGIVTHLVIKDNTGRALRTLGADLVFKTPFVGELVRKGGGTLAGNDDAERLLGRGELVGVWPEGFKGIGKPFSERYKLQRFGRGGFVSAAMRTGVPIVPCSIVGAEEIYPLIGNVRSLARLLGVPYIPITPFFPLLGLLGLIPLPSKWLIEFGEPIRTDEFADGAADDPMLVFNVTDQVRETIQQTLYSLLMQRRSVFF